MNNKNIGYKVLDMNMKSIYGNKDFQYEMNKIYSMNEEDIKICECGYHYYKELKDIATLYSFNTNINRIFEVEILGKEISNNNIQYCTNSIRIIRELNQEEVNKYIEDNLNELINDNHSYVRAKVARQGYGLDILVHAESAFVRKTVAEQGYGLDVLINDNNAVVRGEVAKQGYGLDILINDESWSVRTKVARRGYCLDKLVNDENWIVRREVAKQGYGLDILINDKSWSVRLAVARQGYGLDILVNDENEFVRDIVQTILNNTKGE